MKVKPEEQHGKVDREPKSRVVGELKYECDWFLGYKGCDLFRQTVQLGVQVDGCKGVVVFFHGLQEHHQRYVHVLEAFARIGYFGASFDFRTHGISEQQDSKRGNGVIPEYVEDAVIFLNDLKDRFPDKPLFVIGQSMGGLVLGLSLQHPKVPNIRGVIFTSPAFALATPLQRLMGWVGVPVSKLVPNVRMIASVKPSDMSKDPIAVEEYIKDPLNSIGKIRTRMGTSLIHGMNKVCRELPKNSNIQSMLIGFGDCDRCTSLKGARRVFQKSLCNDKELKIFEGLYHTTFHEPERQQVIDYLINWVEKRLDK